MVTIQQGLRADGFEVSMVKLCRWFGVARRTVYYKPTKVAPKVQPKLAEPIKALAVVRLPHGGRAARHE
ncbi:integrase catalytic subunit [Xanthomonas arboricola]|uniref:integrase catalytic subunit n=1 Tax=Xanthomonas arboricola TaxID=56448 RepID=UPI000CEDC9CA|nr:integrase catalytic subunit [Xanthomonas arboricola]